MKDEGNSYSYIYEVVKLIPYGRVTSYGAIAKCLGMSSGARLVGYAMNQSHGMPDIPAHRVVNRNGLLTGKHHFGHPDRMQELLEAEGVLVKDDQVLDFARLFWDPSTELSLD
jgi:methylated-DNA-protein-cysteine methyltransferase related protein